MLTCDSEPSSGTYTDTLALGRGGGGVATLTGGESFRHMGTAAATAAAAAADGNEDPDVIGQCAAGGGGKEGGVGPWNLAPSEISQDHVLAAAAAAAAFTALQLLKHSTVAAHGD